MNTFRNLIMVLIVLILATGCESSKTKVIRLDLIGNENADFLFWDQLANEVVISNEDVLYALLEIKNGEPPIGDWVAIQSAARDEGILYCNELISDEAATWGTVAYAVVEILDIEGGFMMRRFGPNPRWCLNELYYLGLTPKRTQNEAIRGLEFATVVDMLDSQRSQGDESPIEL